MSTDVYVVLATTAVLCAVCAWWDIRRREVEVARERLALERQQLEAAIVHQERAIVAYSRRGEPFGGVLEVPLAARKGLS